MKNVDVLVVRLLPFVLFILLGVNILCSFSGVDMTLSYEIHGNSALYALGLFLVSLANKRYHCVWNRAMYIFLIFVPMLNFLDSAFYFIPSDRVYMGIIVSSYMATIIVTAYFAIKHFITISKRRLSRGRE